MFDLKRPCTSCPFRKDLGHTFQLQPERLEEISDAPAFQCHKTVDYDAPHARRAGDRPQQCAGLMAVLHRSGAPNTIMQVAQRLEGFDAGTIDPKHEAYASWEEVMVAHSGVARPYKHAYERLHAAGGNKRMPVLLKLQSRVLQMLRYEDKAMSFEEIVTHRWLKKTGKREIRLTLPPLIRIGAVEQVGERYHITNAGLQLIA